MDLDESYGMSILPIKSFYSDTDVHDWEKRNVPDSICTLNEITAVQLKNIMDNVEAGWVFGEKLVFDITIIWIVTENGDIRFAVEESISDQSTEPYQWPRHRRLSSSNRMRKLGHPTLVDCGRGRVGGEILLNANANPIFWELNSKSGRYCPSKGPNKRTLAHLQNVVKKFDKYHIKLEIALIHNEK